MIVSRSGAPCLKATLFPMSAPRSEPPRLLLAWEALNPGVQIAIAFPALFVVIFLLHLGPLNQPLSRALVYGIFWGVAATGALVAASRNEARKRVQRDRAVGDDLPPVA
jgi:hypothetical protein